MKKIFSLSPILQSLCLLGVFNTGVLSASAQSQLLLLAQFTQPALVELPTQKSYFSFNSNPELCDTSIARGWFYWYVDAAAQCHIVPMANLEEANRYASELLENSFYVIVSGYGLRDTNGRPVEDLPALR